MVILGRDGAREGQREDGQEREGCPKSKSPRRESSHVAQSPTGGHLRRSVSHAARFSWRFLFLPEKTHA